MGHKCYISFKTEDLIYKRHILTKLNIDMIDKSLNEPIDSDDEDYIMQRIRTEYLADSSVTIHLIGSRSAENLGQYEQRFIKRELQASLYNGENSPRSGILGIVLPEVAANVYKGSYQCVVCNGNHTYVGINGSTTVKEFSYNYYIPNDKCCHSEDERYCVLVNWPDFCANPDTWIEAAYTKRLAPIADKVKVYP